MDSISNQIEQILDGNFVQEFKDENSIIIKGATKDIRIKLHEFAENNGLHSKSFLQDGSNIVKNMVISTISIQNEINMNQFNSYFVRFYKLPIELCQDSSFEYFLDTVLFLHPSIKDNYSEMLILCKTRFKGDVYAFQEHIENIKKYMMLTIRNSEEFKTFTNDKLPKLKPLVHNVSQNLFVPKNVGKGIMRFDIIKANYNTINIHNPRIFESETWENFVMKFTDLEIMKKSKIFREIIFGELKLVKKVSSMVNDILATIYEKFAHFSPLCILGDEICFEYNEKQVSEIEEYLEANWKGCFRTEKFTLSSYDTKVGTIYIEEYVDKTKIRCCSRKYLMQVVKHHQKKEIISLDRKFIDNGMVATFDENIFF